MSVNQFRKPKKEKAPGKRGAFSRFLHSVLDGSILGRKNVASQMPFLLFLTALALVLIFNTYYAEKQARQIEKARREVVELRTRYINTKSELMFLTNQSEIARRLKQSGFVESTEPPRLVYPAKKNLLTRLVSGR